MKSSTNKRQAPARANRPQATPQAIPQPNAQANRDAPVDERQRIWQAVNAIPRGRVATYGGIAALAGMPRHARLVGRVLSGLPTDTRLPWHRVVQAGGRIALRGGGERIQAERLRDEGVPCLGPRIDLRVYGWPDGEHR